MTSSRSASTRGVQRPAADKDRLPEKIREVIDPALLKAKPKRVLSTRVPTKLKSLHPNLNFSVTHFTLVRDVGGEQWFRVLTRSEGLDYLKRAIKSEIDYDIKRSNSYISIIEKNNKRLPTDKTKKTKGFSLSKEMTLAAARTGVDGEAWASATLAKAAHLINANDHETLRINMATNFYDKLISHFGSKAAFHEWASTVFTYSVQSKEVGGYKRKYVQDTQDGIVQLGVSVPDFVFDAVVEASEKGPLSRNSLSVTIIHDLYERALSATALTPNP